MTVYKHTRVNYLVVLKYVYNTCLKMRVRNGQNSELF